VTRDVYDEVALRAMAGHGRRGVRA
jgi:hypothetical protein